MQRVFDLPKIPILLYNHNPSGLNLSSPVFEKELLLYTQYLQDFRIYCYIWESNISLIMKEEHLRKTYQVPVLRIIPLIPENAICDSTFPGGNEDIGYEDWD